MADSRIDELRRRLEREPGSRLFAQLAEEHRKAGEHAEAVRVARAGLLVHPVYPSARLTIGRALLESGDPVSARIELETALREAPDNILASRFLGQALEAAGDFRGALRQYDATLRMAPGDAQLENQVRALSARLASIARGAEGDRPLRTVPDARPGGVAAGIRPGMPPVGVLPPTLPMRAAERPVVAAVRAVTPAAAAAIPMAPTRAPAMNAGLAGTPAAPPGSPGPSDDTLKPLLPGPPATAEPSFETTVPAGLVPAVVAETPVVAPAAGRPLPTPPEAAAGQAGEMEAATDVGGGVAGLSSSTLAELYLRQGLHDEAVKVYSQVLAEDPHNARARSRLAELQAPAAVGLDERTRRRQTLERTIAGLEGLLGALRRR